MNKKWIKLFRKKFCIVSKDSEDVWIKKSDGKPVIDLYLRWDIEQFISTLQQAQRQSIIEIIKKKAHKDKDYGTLEEPACGVNQTLKEIIKQIK